jgi:hypothetical protein
MNNNGHAKPSQSLPDEICAACGLPANPDSGHVVVEFKAGWILRRQSVECGTADVTTRLWIEVKSPDEGFTKNGGMLIPGRLLYFSTTQRNARVVL